MLKLQAVDEVPAIHCRARNHLASNQTANAGFSSKMKKFLLKV